MGKMKYIKNITLLVLMVSNLVGGFGQMIAWGDSVIAYNAYLQMAIGFGLMLWLSHKLLSHYDRRYSKPVTNARDKK
jgi:hypothetical protein